MTKHTPGPWTCNKGLGSDADYLVWDAGGNYLTLRDDVHEANAQLISSAPALLGVLVRLVSDYHDEGRAIQPGSPIWEAIHAAIAKAKGA